MKLKLQTFDCFTGGASAPSMKATFANSSSGKAMLCGMVCVECVECVECLVCLVCLVCTHDLLNCQL